MEEIDSDRVLEILDTPDRFPSSSDRRMESGRRGPRRCRDFSRACRRTSDSAPQDDTDFFFSQASLARLMSEPSHQAENTAHETKQNGTTDDGWKSVQMIDLSQNSRDARNNSGKNQYSEITTNDSRGGSDVRSFRSTRLVTKRGNVISIKPPVNSSTAELPSLVGDCSVGSKRTDKGKGIDPCGNSQIRTEQTTPRPLQFDAPRGKTEQRRLVRNGCISPSVITKNRITVHKDAATKEEVVGNKMPGILHNGISSHPINILSPDKDLATKEDTVGHKRSGILHSGTSSHPIHILSPDSDGNFTNTSKNKVMVDNNVLTIGSRSKAKARFGRISSASGKGVTIPADVAGDIVGSEDIGPRTVHNRSGKSHEITTGHNGYVNITCGSPERTALQLESNLNPLQASGNKRETLSKGKRKYSQIGECSSSYSDESGIPHLRSSNQTSNPVSNPSHRCQRQGSNLGPVVEVDELCSPEAVQSNLRGQSSRPSYEVSASAIQVESDEILARQLQEQLYNEPPVSRGIEEIDASIAWSLQHEEDAQRSSTATQEQSRHRIASVMSRRSINRTRVPASARGTMPRRNINNALRARLNYLEAMEVAIGNSTNTSGRNLHVQRDFNENDYEMLLSLDENIQHGGASESQINRLPQSIIETDNVQETCAVCLESPVTGDIIRHLPCMHKFHKECIDTWLKRKRLCPICKSGIT